MIAPRLLCLLTLALVPVGAWADPAPWHLPGAAARFVIDLDNPPPGTKPNAPAPPVAWTRFGLPDPSWADAPVRAYDPNGNPVGVKLLWSAPGEPPSWAFDSSSGAKRYFLYVGLPSSSKVFVAPDPLAGWNPEAGALLETRSYDGREVGRVEDFRTLWDKNPVPLGRSLLATVFEGGHRHGPQQNLLSVYHAWFDAPADATYQFATISADASFLLVDGKPVTAWPGRHWWGPGVQGQYHGSIDLTAGPHQLEYDNAYTFRSDGRPPLLCCIAAKAGDGGWAMLRAETAFFRPIRHAHLADYETAPDADTAAPFPKFGFDWDVVDQSVPTANGEALGLIALRFRAYPAKPGWTFAWTFDDGATGDGPKPDHLYLRPGLRQVRLTVRDAHGEIGTLTVPVRVHPNWTQLNTRNPDYNPVSLNPKHRDAALARDPATLQPADLAAETALYLAFEDPASLAKLAPALAQAVKSRSLAEGDLPALLKETAYLSRDALVAPGNAGPAAAMQIDQAVAERAALPDASAGEKVPGAAARLAWAQILLKTTRRTDDVATLLAALDKATPPLAPPDRRAADILRGDLALATGDVDGARKRYAALSDAGAGTPDVDARSSIRRTAKVEQAKAFLDKKDYDAAEKQLAEIEFAAPVEKLAPDCAQVRARLWQERGETAAAALWIERVLPAIAAASARSDLLFRAADLAMAQGDKETARKALKELLGAYPYSEGAAKAKAKWVNDAVF